MITLSNIQVSESGSEPVSLAEVKAWLNIDFTDNDALLTTMITGARQTIEKLMNLFLVEKDVTLDLEVTGCEKTASLPYVKSLDSVTVNELDSSDAETALVSNTDYFLRGNSIRVSPGRYSVAYTVSPEDIPEDLKEAIKMEVAERFQNRGEQGGISEGAREKIQQHIVPWL